MVLFNGARIKNMDLTLYRLPATLKGTVMYCSAHRVTRKKHVDKRREKKEDLLIYFLFFALLYCAIKGWGQGDDQSVLHNCKGEIELCKSMDSEMQTLLQVN